MTRGEGGRSSDDTRPRPRPPGQREGHAHARPTGEPSGTDLAPLLAAAARGDEEAWRRIVGLYARRLFGLARSRRLSEEAAEEVTQSVFVTVAQHLRSGGYAERGRFEPWLFRIAVNRVRDELRRMRRHADATDPAALGDAFPARPEPDARDDGASFGALRDALARLPDADREVVDLRHHGGLSFKQIADLLGEPLGTVLARHHRALRKIREIMEHEPGGA